jgi:hypothetical protein
LPKTQLFRSDATRKERVVPTISSFGSMLFLNLGRSDLGVSRLDIESGSNLFFNFGISSRRKECIDQLF